MLVTNSLEIWSLLLSATAVLTSPIVLESLDETPADWQESDSLDPDQIIEFSIGLQPEDSQSLDTALYGAPDPDHPNHGKHLSGESAKALLNPSNEATESVKRWLTDAGIPEHHFRDEDLRIRDSRRSRVSFSKTWLVYPLE
ncbi:Putative tripeptidyl-peptidase SED2 [Fusarium oxysporum f. sp. cubense race 1]|uniref:Putative tripeptidyl-peptidase SED2 n=1 Tax=Fusarium oxysporum f. sp. cubense (strain race 1) TaxID=1229664 RepID=N4U876_FUSC1|nr:Putative tripeptidyl-peptidase SED2 [Fusarium oxysporum f. sp. cubense race 1]